LSFVADIGKYDISLQTRDMTVCSVSISFLHLRSVVGAEILLATFLHDRENFSPLSMYILLGHGDMVQERHFDIILNGNRPLSPTLSLFALSFTIGF